MTKHLFDLFKNMGDKNAIARSVYRRLRGGSITDHIKTDEDVLSDNGYTWTSFKEWCKDLDEQETAMRFLKLLVKSLNHEWQPDFDNNSESKYEPRFTGGSSGFRFSDDVTWAATSTVGSRLCFKTSDLATHAGKQFLKWYKKVIVG